MKRKKVLLIGPMPPPRGGVSTHLFRLLEHSKTEDDLELVILDIRRLHIYFQNYSTHNLFTIIRTFLVSDIVHVHISRKLKRVLLMCARLFNKKVLYTHHNSRNLKDILTVQAMTLADQVILVRDVVDQLAAEIQKKCVVIPAFISSNQSDPLPEELEVLFSSGQIVFSHCYQKKQNPILIDGKDLYGFDLIFDAIDIIQQRDQNPDLIFVLADPNDAMKDYYQERIRKANQIPGIKVIYWIRELDFSSILPKCRILLRATRSDGDAISVREALQFGVPVLASDCVERPLGVKTFLSGDAESMANSLSQLIRYDEREVFQQENYALKIFKLYRSL